MQEPQATNTPNLGGIVLTVAALLTLVGYLVYPGDSHDPAQMLQIVRDHSGAWKASNQLITFGLLAFAVAAVSLTTRPSRVATSRWGHVSLVSVAIGALLAVPMEIVALTGQFDAAQSNDLPAFKEWSGFGMGFVIALAFLAAGTVGLAVNEVRNPVRGVPRLASVLAAVCGASWTTACLGGFFMIEALAPLEYAAIGTLLYLAYLGIHLSRATLPGPTPVARSAPNRAA